MANDIKLQESHPLDQHLRPIKVGGKSSCLELSSYENGIGAKVHNNLDIEGNLKVTGDTESSVKDMYFGSGLFRVEAYSGMIIGYTCIGRDSTVAYYNVTNSWDIINGLSFATFQVPPSGNVEIEISIFIDTAAQGRPLYFGLSTAGTYAALDVTHEHEVFTADETDESTLTHKWVITGLTAGTSTTYWVSAKSSHSSVHVLRWGGDATQEYGPMIIKTTALPSIMKDYDTL